MVATPERFPRGQKTPADYVPALENRNGRPASSDRQPDDRQKRFEQAARYVLTKNAEIYKQLA